MAFIIITGSFLPKSVNFLVDMRCKSYCNGTNFCGNKFSRIPLKLVKLNTHKVFFNMQLEKIVTAKKLEKSMVCKIHPQKRKTQFHSYVENVLSLENIHQLSQLQLPRFIYFFPFDIRIYPKFFLILVDYFFVSLNPHISNVTFLYSLKRLNLKVCWRFQGISKYNNGKIWVKLVNFYHTIRFQISLMKSITLLLKSLVGSYVTFGNWMFFQNNQNKTQLTLSTF